MKMNILPLILIILVLTPMVLAQEDSEEIQLLGFDLEEVIGVLVFAISLVLFVLTFMAYQRDGRKKFLLISMAFLLFAIKSLIDASELFIEEIEILGPIAVILELFVILFFFFGVVKKER